MADRRPLLRGMYEAAVAAASPMLCVPPNLPPPPTGRTVVVGAGKAAAAMAAAVEANWTGPLEGVVVTRYGHSVGCERIEVVEAGHPVPDEAGLRAARRIIQLSQSLNTDDLMLCLISGGGSALLSLPAEGVTLADKQTINRSLLLSGATISEINTVRKHLSALKGGRLAAAAAPARVVSLIISDVPGDDPSVVASGPTVPDSTTVSDARAIVSRYAIDVPENVSRRLSSDEAETPKPGDAVFDRVENIVVATAGSSLDAAAILARQSGYDPRVLGDAIEGEARDVGSEQAALALEVAGAIGSGPVAIISGGETTVTVRGRGRGGRNSEYLLAAALRLEGHRRIWAMAADTDGIDGSEDNAGAFFGPGTLERARQAGLDPAQRLEANDAYSVFEAAGDLLITGPTRTNVNDFRAILIDRD